LILLVDKLFFTYIPYLNDDLPRPSARSLRVDPGPVTNREGGSGTGVDEMKTLREELDTAKTRRRSEGEEVHAA
jgi:hypothetical protein